MKAFFGAVALGLLVLATISTVQAICNLPPPVDPPPPDNRPGNSLPSGPRGGINPEGRTPTDDPDTGTPTPGSGDTPPSDPDPAPRPPNAGGSPGGPIGGPGGVSSGGLGGAPRSRPAANLAGSWHIWWELNREHMLGLRKTIAWTEPASGGTDSLGYLRDRVRQALRKTAMKTTDKGLKAAALRALGRSGEDIDAMTFLRILRRPDLPDEVLEGAAIGLASLSHIEDEDLKKELRRFFADVLAGKIALPHRTRLIAIMMVSLRARDDSALVRSLGARCRSPIASASEAAALLFACGLAKHPMLAAEATKAARTGAMGQRKLHDVARAHAVLGAVMTGEKGLARDLVGILTGKDSREHTRRAAAMALGILHRDGLVREDEQEYVRRALLGLFESDRDSLVVGYLALAMGYSAEPGCVERLRKTVDRTGDAVVKPFAALGLGLAARRLPDGPAVAKIRAFLAAELAKNREIELSAALSVAVGLAGAGEARDLLLSRVASDKLKASVRGPACEALGLLGDLNPRVLDALTKALDDSSAEVVEDAAIALGLIGRRDAARLIVEKLRTTKSEALQAHLVVALSHLGGTVAIEPLLEILADRGAKHTVRESAATVLGILTDPREVDPLFEIDASVNPFSLTRATRELVRVY